MKVFTYEERPPVGELHSSKYIRRYENNPLLTAEQVPFPCDLAFNAGVAQLNGKYYMAFRFDRYTPKKDGLALSGTGFAESEDGIQWNIFPQPARFLYHGKELRWVNDARLTELNGELYLSFCFNSLHGERPGFARWKGGTDFEVVSLGIPAQRNLILCPGKINGKYWRLERPVTRCTVYNIWMSYSEDLIHWGESELLLGVEDVPFATKKVGGSAPPLLTDRGWLMTFHAVDNDPSRDIYYEKPWPCHWCSRYTMGALLLDRDNPFHILGMTQRPLLVPEMAYETGNPEKFFRENVVFPCGALRDGEDLRIYYGAGDYSTCMAKIRFEDLWKEITPYSRIADEAVYSQSDLD